MKAQNTSERVDSVVRLRDGRGLACLEVGKPDGFPLLHFHGFPSSRLEALLLADAAVLHNVRIIALDRPGIGASDSKRDFGILQWPDDVVEVADRLDIERFGVSGFSGGAAAALACAYKIPQRLIVCGLISPAVPVSFLKQVEELGKRMRISIVNRIPAALVRVFMRRTFRKQSKRTVADFEKALLENRSRLGSNDERLLRDPDVRRIWAEAVTESTRRCVDGSVADALMLARPWPFAVEEIGFPHIVLRHGQDDRIVPVAAARLLADALPHCEAAFDPEEGHLSTLVNHATDIIGRLRHV